jgi:hypothetical protein
VARPPGNRQADLVPVLADPSAPPRHTLAGKLVVHIGLSGYEVPVCQARMGLSIGNDSSASTNPTLMGAVGDRRRRSSREVKRITRRPSQISLPV